jgi:hypothetical protein
MAIFTSKIICNHCGKFYKRKNERDKFKWICQGYDNYSECRRIVIDEEGMKEFISRRLYPQDRSEDNISLLINNVDKIQIEDRFKFTVHIKNDQPMYRNGNHTQY